LAKRHSLAITARTGGHLGDRLLGAHDLTQRAEIGRAGVFFIIRPHHHRAGSQHCAADQVDQPMRIGREVEPLHDLPVFECQVEAPGRADAIPSADLLDEEGSLGALGAAEQILPVDGQDGVVEADVYRLVDTGESQTQLADVVERQAVADLGDVESQQVPPAAEGRGRLDHGPALALARGDGEVGGQVAARRAQADKKQVVGPPVAFDVPVFALGRAEQHRVVVVACGDAEGSAAGFRPAGFGVEDARTLAGGVDELDDLHLGGILEVHQHGEPPGLEFVIGGHQPVGVRGGSGWLGCGRAADKEERRGQDGRTEATGQQAKAFHGHHHGTYRSEPCHAIAPARLAGRAPAAARQRRRRKRDSRACADWKRCQRGGPGGQRSVICHIPSYRTAASLTSRTCVLKSDGGARCLRTGPIALQR
jgi:hypothetical protein